MVYKVCIPTMEDCVNKVQTKVYKNRIRVKEFFVDFDKLRSGYISQSQFKSGLCMAGLNLTPEELQVLAESYANPDDPQLRVSHTLFTKHIDCVFGKTDLEKAPQEPCYTKPTGLVNPNRFSDAPTKDLGEDLEYHLVAILDKLSYDCSTKRILVKPFFDDYSKNQNSPLLVNHVSAIQFRQVLKNHIAPELGSGAVDLIIGKFCGEGQFDDMVNYVAFAQAVDAPDGKFDPYTLKAL